MDLGCYTLHLQRFLSHAPRVVAARGGERAGHPGVDEWLESDLEHADGVTGFAHCRMAAPDWQITCHVYGSRGEALAHNVVLPQCDDRLTVGTGDDAVATAELIDAAYTAAGMPPRPRTRL